MDTLTLLTITETCPHQYAILMTSSTHVSTTVHKGCALAYAEEYINKTAQLVNAEHVVMLEDGECMYCGDNLDAFDPEWVESLSYEGSD